MAIVWRSRRSGSPARPSWERCCRMVRTWVRTAPGSMTADYRSQQVRPGNAVRQARQRRASGPRRYTAAALAPVAAAAGVRDGPRHAPPPLVARHHDARADEIQHYMYAGDTALHIAAAAYRAAL